ncbi:MAG TPA: SH3 domain-containing protein [Melioribacteraceae bacterium]|nr:SH3 domain-containing protein [Melioribacteraceae bacterium]
MKKLIFAIFIILFTISRGSEVKLKNTLITQDAIGDFFIGGIPKICNPDLDYISFTDTLEEEGNIFTINKVKIFDNDNLVGVLSIDENNRIVEVTALSDKYKTQKNIHVESTIEDLFKVYKNIKIYVYYFDTSHYIYISTSDLPNVLFLVSEDDQLKNTGIQDGDIITYKKNDFKPNTKIKEILLKFMYSDENTFSCAAGKLELVNSEGDKPANILLNGKSIYQTNEVYPYLHLNKRFNVYLDEADIYVVNAETGGNGTSPDIILLKFYGKDKYKIISDESFYGEIKKTTKGNNYIEYNLGYEDNKIKNAVLEGDKISIRYIKSDKINLSESALGCLEYHFQSMAEDSYGRINEEREVFRIFETPGFNKDAYNKLVAKTKKTKKAPSIKDLRKYFNNPGEEPDGKTYSVTGDNVRFRDAPSLNSKILSSKFMKNDKVKALSLYNTPDGNRFAKIEYNGLIGYISVDFLEEVTE